MLRVVVFVIAVQAMVVQAVSVPPAAADTRILCTLIEEIVDGRRTVVRDGDCATRRSPASTFKIAIALMGFDAGILTAPDAPQWRFRQGYVDWREAWKQPADPSRWMRESVVWYSQQVTARLGRERFQAYLDAFGYGNRDATGDSGEGNGLSTAWLSSSLKISPQEQVAFLARMLSGGLPVDPAAIASTAAIVDHGTRHGGWHVRGKTGAYPPRDADGRVIWGRPVGWFVGWAEREGRTVVFARLTQETEKIRGSAGARARDGLFATYFDPRDGIPE